jgi:hypothetical protein
MSFLFLAAILKSYAAKSKNGFPLSQGRLQGEFTVTACWFAPTTSSLERVDSYYSSSPPLIIATNTMKSFSFCQGLF